MVPFLALVLAQTQPSITFSIGASRVPVILEKLSSQTGMEFRSVPQLQDEVLFISVKNAPLNELMSEIAHVTHCTWEKNPKDGFDLIRTQGQELADEAAENLLSLSLLRKALQRGNVKPPPPVWSLDETQANLQRVHDINARVGSDLETNESRQADYEALRDLNITSREVDRLFGTFDPEVFADQRPWEYRRYTENPNQLQYGLPSGAADAIEGFRSEEQVALSKLDGANDRDKFQIAREYGLGGSYLRPLQGPVLALVRSHLMGSYFQWEIAFCDSAGNAIESGSKSASLQAPSNFVALAGMGSWGKVRFKYPPEIANGRRPSKVGPKPEDLAVVESPLEHDPLGLVCDAGLTRLSAEVSRDIVAALPDECIGQVPQSETLANFCIRLGSSVAFKIEDGRLLIEPTRRAEAYAVRAKRAPLETLLKGLAGDPIPLDRGASYALAQNDRAGFSPLENNVFTWNHHAAGVDRMATDLCDQQLGQRLKLEFYGLLSESQKRTMEKGGIQFRELDSEEQNLMARWLYGTDVRLQLGPSDLRVLENRRQPVAPTYLEQDPTFSLPQGIPGSALITVNDRKTLAVVDTNPGESLRVWDCPSVAYIATQQERGEFLDPRMGYPMVAQMQVKPATSTMLNFTVQYMPRLAEHFQLQGTSVESSEPVKIRDLPAQWLSEVDMTLAQYREMFRNAPSRPQQQRTGPPE